MRRLKTKQELEQERIDAHRYALGNVILNIEKLLLIYARQSSSKQYVSNIYSAKAERARQTWALLRTGEHQSD